ncbi:hypothetical protein ICA16_15225 [Pseudomonas anatoliensis]|uniref:hypothetical protein n=1 Tax=Pseudomonas anatoliensis TaxID=2710589 RepID=UPI001B31CC5D|nr:hypothetical protein [Pseudomonas anatoliensis]MBP5957023.1 hypothetical protein [Pseudomonas anatoliensis]
MQMDNAPYMLESSVMMAPIERRITDFNNSTRVGMVVVPSSTSAFPAYEFRSNVVSYGSFRDAAKLAAAKRHSDLTGFNESVIGVLDVKDGWTVNELIDIKVKPITGKIIAAIEEQLDSIYALDAAAIVEPEQSRLAIRAVVDVVEDYIKAKDLWSLNELLVVADPSLMRKITSVSILRTSFRMRDKLSNWTALYDRVNAHLKETEQDPERALRGLSRPKVVKIA